jgi:hypothetical protein
MYNCKYVDLTGVCSCYDGYTDDDCSKEISTVQNHTWKYFNWYHTEVDGKSPYTFVLLHFLVPRVHNPFEGRLIPDGGVDISFEQSSSVYPS